MSIDSFYYSRKELKSVVWMLNSLMYLWVNGWSMLNGVVLDFKALVIRKVENNSVYCLGSKEVDKDDGISK